MPPLMRIRTWERAHPMTADACLGVLVFAISLYPFLDGPDQQRHGTEPTPFLFAVFVLACGCLVFRRRSPWTVWAATTALGWIAVFVSEGPTQIYVPAVIALYTVSVRTGATIRVLTATVASAVVPVVLIIAASPQAIFEAVGFGMSAWSALALMTGIAVRAQRAVVDAANERALQAEATREEEAQRRVAEERLRIAREIHDVVAHHVSAINVQAGVASVLMRSDPAGATEAMAHVRRSSQAVLHEVPGILRLLRVSDDDLETSPLPTLADAEHLVEQARFAGQHVVWQTTGTPRALAPTIDLTAYRVVQEAMTNATKYGTGHISIQLDYSTEALTLKIHNPPAAPHTTPSPGRHGLIGMRERVLAAGGMLTAGPREDGTWVVDVHLPLGRDGLTAALEQQR